MFSFDTALVAGVGFEPTNFFTGVQEGRQPLKNKSPLSSSKERGIRGVR